ncbi:M24 family metallopeptidase [Candidatus Caldatribacterium sp.]|uniref:M24 family metallopeptidase n=1 Tax=Candidatus Caldatribacterium sp. TaxID=2282143 RepID=UPI002990AB91|nr:Xaa-Pro peptidase family protein [Candidatus Caldatribacterium sp.]MDW8080784.1 Xaa-Pro peptidase family protein [Candidatus Calescibacterium sp.]
MFAKRLERLQRMLEEPLLVVSPGNLFYLSGFRGSLGFLLVLPEGRPFFFCDGRYVIQSHEELGIEAEIVEFDQDVVESVCSVLSSLRLHHLLVEDVASVHFARRLEEKKCPVSFVPSPVHTLRAVKDEGEIQAIRQAVALAEAAFWEVLPLIQEGVEERDIAVELEYRMRKHGGEAVAFPTIVASGRRSALPHARPTACKVRKGEWVLVDWGAKANGYCADLTRVIPIGKVMDPRFREVLLVLSEAQRIALSHIREGIEAGLVDRKIREFFGQRGLAEYFTHSLGHGIGIDVHEEPKLSSQSRTILRSGMVVTVEPGVYVPGWGGARLEHMVLVTEHGCTLLDTLPEISF